MLIFTKDNIWGGLPWKCWLDALAEGDHQLVLDFWNITMTISPIRKDVKHRHIFKCIFWKNIPFIIYKICMQTINFACFFHRTFYSIVGLKVDGAHLWLSPIALENSLLKNLNEVIKGHILWWIHLDLPFEEVIYQFSFKKQKHLVITM